MSDNQKNSAGALHGELRIELHTHYAAGIWDGRSASGAKRKLTGMPSLLSMLSRIYSDSLAGSERAVSALSDLEAKLNVAGDAFRQQRDELEAMFAMLPEEIWVSDAISSQSLTVVVRCKSPSGYRLACLLVGFDQLALGILQAHYYGLISMKERKARLHYCSHQIRHIFAVVARYSTESAG